MFAAPTSFSTLVRRDSISSQVSYHYAKIDQSEEKGKILISMPQADKQTAEGQAAS